MTRLGTGEKALFSHNEPTIAGVNDGISDEAHEVL